ncbi:MAG: hypothetical protein U0271_42210 [Polyangiaceae bacterium]
MSAIPESVSYKWTAQDRADAIEGKQVTPYNFHPTAIPNSKTIELGTKVNMPLQSAKILLAIKRFEAYDWEEVPEAIAKDAKTLADLGKALLATKNKKYPEECFKFDTMSESQRKVMTHLILEHWSNTEYRYALMASKSVTAATWAESDPASKVPTTAKDGSSEFRIKVIPVRAATPATNAAKPGAEQKVVVSDELLAKMDADIKRLTHLNSELSRLLQRSAETLKRRAELAKQFEALEVLCQVSSTGKNWSPDMDKAWVASTALKKTAIQSLKTAKLRELYNPPNADPHLIGVIQKEFGWSTDIAADIKKYHTELTNLLLSDPAEATRAADYVGQMLDRKVTATGPYVERCKRAVAAVIDSAAIMLEIGISSDLDQALAGIVQRAPKKPVVSRADVNTKTFVDVIFSWASASALINAGLTIYGNLAGPPSLMIAFIQLRTWNRVYGALKSGKLSKPELQTLLDETLKEMEIGIPPTANMRKTLAEAIKKGDHQILKGAQRDFMDELTAGRQGTTPIKTGLVLVQLVGIIVSCIIAAGDVKDGKPADVILVDGLGLASQVPMFFVGLADVALTSNLGKQAFTVVAKKIPLKMLQNIVADFDGAAAKIGMLGMKIGAITAVFGMISAALQFSSAYADGDKAGMVIAGAGFVGSAASFAACVLYLAGVPCPPLQVAALAIATVATLLGLIKAAIDAAEPGGNRLARSLFAVIESNPYFAIIANDSKFKTDYDALKTKLTYKPLSGIDYILMPTAKNNMFTRAALHDAGFSEDHIALVVDKDGASILPTTVSLQPQ